MCMLSNFRAFTLKFDVLILSFSKTIFFSSKTYQTGTNNVFFLLKKTLHCHKFLKLLLLTIHIYQ